MLSVKSQNTEAASQARFCVQNYSDIKEWLFAIETTTTVIETPAFRTIHALLNKKGAKNRKETAPKRSGHVKKLR